MTRRHPSAAVVKEHLDRERRLLHKPLGPHAPRGTAGMPRKPRPPSWYGKTKTMTSRPEGEDDER